MTKEQYEKELELRWKEFWDAIVINAIDNNYWKSIFQNAFETGFNRGFAYANDKPYSDAVFEHRNLSQDSANCDNHIVQDHELVEHFAESRNMLRLKIATQFAIVIMTGPGDRILDTHLGSGSSMIAAWDLGFDFTGIEIDPVYYKAAVNRFCQHIAQGRLF